jgi:3-oxoacyl-[acyl-carrier protein] reductase
VEGRTALVTGGSRGIGAAIVRAFAAEGADIAFCHDDDDAGAAQVIADAASKGRRAVARKVDIGTPEACRELFAWAEGELGRIDVLVNNAGVSEEALVEETRYESLR